MTDPVFETRCLSSLSKVFPDEDLRDEPYRAATSLLNETFMFQVAYRSNRLLKSVQVRVESELKEMISTSSVGLVPSELPCYHDHDEMILRSVPGLYPDPLYAIHPADGLTTYPNQWRSIWISVDPSDRMRAGKYAIDISLELAGQVLGFESFSLEVIPAKLPEQKLIHTEWLHADCIATHYKVQVFSDEHWNLLDSYFQTAVKHGVNMILTPLFTPPLDTAVGGERPTVQLVDVEKNGDAYRFGFDKLNRWIDLSLCRGVRYFEFSHLFTQWGAKHAPKIMANVDGNYEQIFGWETDAHGHEYQHFLSQFLKELVACIELLGIDKQCYFHISDEPQLKDLECYQNASLFMSTHLAQYPIIDALSDYAFFEKGLVQNPIPATDHIEDFLHLEHLWTYYCCSQYKKVSNRFFNMPSARQRILGMQLYKYRISGFLHWGYNFWYSQYSKAPVNPFAVTDAGGAYPSGDPFLVYPGETGAIESIRLKVMLEAMQDLQALQLLESMIGRNETTRLLDEDTGQPITFKDYPRSQRWILEKREKINRMIEKHATG